MYMHARSTAVRVSPRSFVVPRLSLRVSCRVVSWPKPRSRWVSHRRVNTRARQWRDTLPVIAAVDIASVGVVIIAFVILTVFCLSLII